MKFPFDTKELFDNCVKNDRMPKNDFKKQAVLLRILEGFEDRVYSEEEVNEKIKVYFSDFATVRRELVNYGYFSKDSYKSEYRVVKRELTLEDIENNTILKKHAEAYL
ncbi:DUF2087 domain-containing protein [archaeon]|jgi:hypothetical protein|nr:DUF2087 domain-containing protein [archaeon]MBT4397460.1 DUF2087 domain-containing protein [archaeon]MBT4440532.1 DUF2087 domain-containing protein [archaeon]